MSGPLALDEARDLIAEALKLLPHKISAGPRSNEITVVTSETQTVIVSVALGKF